MFLPVTSFYPFTFYSVISLIHSLVNANGIPYVYAAFCDFVTMWWTWWWPLDWSKHVLYV